MKLLKSQKWQSPYELRETRGTLDSLFRRGLVNRKVEVGASFDPTIMTFYKSKYRM